MTPLSSRMKELCPRALLPITSKPRSTLILRSSKTSCHNRLSGCAYCTHLTSSSLNPQTTLTITPSIAFRRRTCQHQDLTDKPGTSQVNAPTTLVRRSNTIHRQSVTRARFTDTHPCKLSTHTLFLPTISAPTHCLPPTIHPFVSFRCFTEAPISSPPSRSLNCK